MRRSPAVGTRARVCATGLLIVSLLLVGTSLKAQRSGPLGGTAVRVQSAWSSSPQWRSETLLVGVITELAPVSPTGSKGRAAGASGGGTSSGGALRARVRVQRVLHGEAVQEGDALTISWPVVASQIPLTRGGAVAVESPLYGLFVLDKQRRPLSVRFGAAPSYVGGYFVPMPAEPATRPKASLSASSAAEGALAAEAFAVLEHYATVHGKQLDEAAEASRRAGWYPSLEAGHFQQWSSIVGRMDPMNLRDDLRRLLASDSRHLQMVAIHSLLGLGDLGAFEQLERDFGAYRKAMQPPHFFERLTMWSVAAQPRSVDLAGRLALHEDIDPVLETSLTRSLAQARIPDSLPYLVALLGSPHASTHSTALEGVCRLTVGDLIVYGGDPNLPQRPPVLTGYAPAGATGYCRQVRMRKPDGSPANVADRAETARFWQAWWNATQETLASDFRRNERGTVLSFGEARPPTRWLDAERPVMQEQPGGPRVALKQLLYPFRPNSLPDGDAEKMLRRMLGPQAHASRADWKVAAQALKTYARTLQMVQEQYDQKMRQLHAAGDGQPPSREALAEAINAREQGFETLLDDCLRELEAKLSPKGWADFQEMLKQRDAQQRRYTLGPNRSGPIGSGATRRP